MLNGAASLREALAGIVDIAVREAKVAGCAALILDPETSAQLLDGEHHLPEPLATALSQLGPDSSYVQIALRGVPYYDLASAVFNPALDGHPSMPAYPIAIVPLLHGRRAIACLHLHALPGQEIPAPARTVVEELARAASGVLAHFALEEETLRNAAVLERMADACGDGIAIVEQSVVRYANSVASGCYGYRRGATMHGIDSTLLDPSELARLSPLLVEMHHTGKPPPELEYWIILDNGERRFIHCTFTSLSGRYDSYSVFIRDETQRRREQEELRGRKLHLRAITEVVSDAVISFDDNDVITFWNPAAQTAFGYSESEALGRPVSLILPEACLTAHAQQRRRLAARVAADGNDDTATAVTVTPAPTSALELAPGPGPGRAGLEMLGRRRDGSEFPARFYGGAWRTSTGLGYTYVIRDITDQKRIESMASAINVMDNIGYVFTGIRHELGNPVNNIKSTVTVLQRQLDRSSKQTIREHLRWIADEVARVEYLLHSLKSFSMFESPAPLTLELRAFFDELLPLVAGDIRKRNISLKLDVSDEATRVYADPRALKQVMLNLLSNAIDALAGRPEPEIALSTSRREQRVALVVADNGCGIADDQLPKLYKPFFTTKKDGSGLGLSLVSKMLAKMKGSITIETQINRGTRVTVLLPESET